MKTKFMAIFTHVRTCGHTHTHVDTHTHTCGHTHTHTHVVTHTHTCGHTHTHTCGHTHTHMWTHTHTHMWTHTHTHAQTATSAITETAGEEEDADSERGRRRSRQMLPALPLKRVQHWLPRSLCTAGVGLHSARQCRQGQWSTHCHVTHTT